MRLSFAYDHGTSSSTPIFLKRNLPRTVANDQLIQRLTTSVRPPTPLLSPLNKKRALPFFSSFIYLIRTTLASSSPLSTRAVCASKKKQTLGTTAIIMDDLTLEVGGVDPCLAVDNNDDDDDDHNARQTRHPPGCHRREDDDTTFPSRVSERDAGGAPAAAAAPRGELLIPLGNNSLARGGDAAGSDDGTGVGRQGQGRGEVVGGETEEEGRRRVGEGEEVGQGGGASCRVYGQVVRALNMLPQKMADLEELATTAGLANEV